MLRVNAPAMTTAGVTLVTRPVTSPKSADLIAGIGIEIDVTEADAIEAAPLRGAMVVVTAAETAEIGGILVDDAMIEVEMIEEIDQTEITLTGIVLTRLTRTMIAVAADGPSQCPVPAADLDLVPTLLREGMITEMAEGIELVGMATEA